MGKDKNETLRNAMYVLDEFYKDTAIMIETLRGVLIKEYGYKDASGNPVCRKGSSSLKESTCWTPLYLSFFVKKDTEYISFAIPLKNYFGNNEPKQEYYIYGCKFFNVKKLDKLPLLAYHSVESPEEEYKKTPKDNFIAVEMEENFDSGKCIIKSLWDMKDRQAVADFAKQIVDL